MSLKSRSQDSEFAKEKRRKALGTDAKETNETIEANSAATSGADTTGTAAGPQMRDEIRREFLILIRKQVKYAQDRISDLSRFENFAAGEWLVLKELLKRQNDFSGDKEIEDELATLVVLIDEQKRLGALSYGEQRDVQFRYDDSMFKLQQEQKESFLQTSSFFEKLAVLAVALLGAFISGMLALTAHLPPGAMLAEHNLAAASLALYILSVVDALVGQFAARFQSDLTLTELTKEVGNAELKKSAFVYLATDERRKEYERLSREIFNFRKRRASRLDKVTSAISQYGGLLPTVLFLICIFAALILSGHVILANLAGG